MKSLQIGTLLYIFFFLFSLLHCIKGAMERKVFVRVTKGRKKRKKEGEERVMDTTREAKEKKEKTYAREKLEKKA